MKRRPDLYVSDTVLTAPSKTALPFGHANLMSNEKPRLTDGVRHPVTVRKATDEEMKRL